MTFLQNFVSAIRSVSRVAWWLIGTSIIYAVFALVNVYWPMVSLLWIQMAWIVMMSLPLWLKPIARLVDMKTLWEK